MSMPALTMICLPCRYATIMMDIMLSIKHVVNMANNARTVFTIMIFDRIPY